MNWSRGCIVTLSLIVVLTLAMPSGVQHFISNNIDRNIERIDDNLDFKLPSELQPNLFILNSCVKKVDSICF